MRKTNLSYAIFALFAIAASIILYMDANATEIDYYTYADNLDLAEIIDSDDLTIEMIENRNGKLIIERAIGVVTDVKTGSGHMVNNANSYISYSCVKGIEDGNVICTYFVYNPDNNACDDIISRFDYIIDININE